MHRGTRIIGAAIVAAAGGVTIALNRIAGAIRRSGDEVGVVGWMMLLIGGGLFLIDSVMSFRSDVQNKND